MPNWNFLLSGNKKYMQTAATTKQAVMSRRETGKGKYH
jgi:hypothetical protein